MSVMDCRPELEEPWNPGLEKGLDCRLRLQAGLQVWNSGLN